MAKALTERSKPSRGAGARDGQDAGTPRRQRLWREFPRRHLGTVLEVGCGYGRVAMLLSRERGVTCERYLGVDIARQMLTRFARYRREFDLFPGAAFDLVCASFFHSPS